MYNALFFFDFLFNRIVPNLYISNAGLGTEWKAKRLTISRLAFLFAWFFPTFSPQAQKYSSKSLFSLATQYKYTTFEKR